MQPIFLKELIPQRDLLELKAASNPYEEEEEEEGKKETEISSSLASSNLFDDDYNIGMSIGMPDSKNPISPASMTKRGRSGR